MILAGSREYATTPIEEIWCEKIRGCSYREAVRRCAICGLAPPATSVIRTNPLPAGLPLAAE